MALGKKKAAFGSSAQKDTSKDFRTVGSIWESKKKPGSFRLAVQEDRTAADGKEYKAAGRLFFQDAATGAYYQVKTLYLIEPKKPIEGLQFNVSLNISNPVSVTPVDADEGEATEEAELDNAASTEEEYFEDDK